MITMLIHLTIGALMMTATLSLVDYSRKNKMSINWWQWLLTVGCVLYGTFVLEMIIGFLLEGAPQAALVMGLATGIVAIVWGVIVRRFIFKKA